MKRNSWQRGNRVWLVNLRCSALAGLEILPSQEVIRTILTISVQADTLMHHTQTHTHTLSQSYPDSLVVRAGEQLWAVRRELDTLDPAQVTAAVSHLLIGLQVPQLQDTHIWILYAYLPVYLNTLSFLDTLSLKFKQEIQKIGFQIKIISEKITNLL